jgi:hypothetical protein
VAPIPLGAGAGVSGSQPIRPVSVFEEATFLAEHHLVRAGMGESPGLGQPATRVAGSSGREQDPGDRSRRFTRGPAGGVFGEESLENRFVSAVAERETRASKGTETSARSAINA